jgi:cytochrome P450
LAEYLLGRIESAREGATPGSLIAELATKPNGLKAWELIGDIAAFVVTGLQTVSGLIGNAMLALTQNRDQFERLRIERSIIDSALEELVRFDGPLHLTARVATADLEVGGVRIAAGEQAIVLLAAANRDPAHFHEPDRLDLGRTGNDHLGYGVGVHACFAAPLARLVCGKAITALLGGLDGIELSGEPTWNDSVTMRGLSSLPVTFK